MIRDEKCRVVNVCDGIEKGESEKTQLSEGENSPLQRLPTLHLSVVNPPIQNSSTDSPVDSIADSPTSTLSALSISKWSIRGPDATCATPTTDESTITADIEPPPDGGYGWVCVLSCFLINAFSWGVVSVRPPLPPFHPPLSPPPPSPTPKLTPPSHSPTAYT